MKLTRMLQDLYLDQMAEAPEVDPRRTPDCLAHAEIQELALDPQAGTTSQLSHIVECSLCRKNWQTFKRLGRLPDALTGPAAAVSPRLWSSDFSAHVSRILASASYLIEESATPTPAHFDGEGTLRVHWSGLAQEGPVAVSLLVEDRTFLLTRGVVRNGFLDIVEPLAGLGQRNIELPVGLLVLEHLAN